MVENNLAASVSGFWCCLCWRSVTLPWLDGEFEINQVIFNVIRNTCDIPALLRQVKSYAVKRRFVVQN